MKKRTQKDMVLDYLKHGRSLTSLKAWELFGISRLSSIIHRLRKEGYHIETETIEGKTRLGLDARYGAYRMKEVD